MMLTPKNNWVCLDCSYREDAGNETSAPKQKKPKQLSSITHAGGKENLEDDSSTQKASESKIERLNKQYADDLASGKEGKRRGNFQAKKGAIKSSKPKQPAKNVAQYQRAIPSEAKLILDKRLEKGEVNIAEYKELRKAIEDDPNDSIVYEPPPRKPLRITLIAIPYLLLGMAGFILIPLGFLGVGFVGEYIELQKREFSVAHAVLSNSIGFILCVLAIRAAASCLRDDGLGADRVKTVAWLEIIYTIAIMFLPPWPGADVLCAALFPIFMSALTLFIITSHPVNRWMEHCKRINGIR
jgi:hypothetical protein